MTAREKLRSSGRQWLWWEPEVRKREALRRAETLRKVAADEARKKEMKELEDMRRECVKKTAEEAIEKAAEADEMEGVIVTRYEEENEMEELCDMEGVEPEGLYASRHAPDGNEHTGSALQVTSPKATAVQQGKEKGKAVKGKAVTPVVPRPVIPAVPRSILRCPETVAGRDVGREKGGEDGSLGELGKGEIR